jgi:transcriptional regulator with XRE-family HTH domain
MSTDDPKLFAVRLSSRLRALRLRQSDLARHLGINATTVSAWASGRNFARPPVMRKIADFLETNIDYLYGTTDSPVSPALVSSQHRTHRGHTLIGSRLQWLRLNLQMTSYELGLTVGVDEQTVSNWETGKDKPSPEQILLLSESLAAATGWLTGVSNNRFLDAKENRRTFSNPTGINYEEESHVSDYLGLHAKIHLDAIEIMEQEGFTTIAQLVTWLVKKEHQGMRERQENQEISILREAHLKKLKVKNPSKGSLGDYVETSGTGILALKPEIEELIPSSGSVDDLDPETLQYVRDGYLNLRIDIPAKYASKITTPPEATTDPAGEASAEATEPKRSSK